MAVNAPEHRDSRSLLLCHLSILQVDDNSPESVSKAFSCGIDKSLFLANKTVLTVLCSLHPDLFRVRRKM